MDGEMVVRMAERIGSVPADPGRPGAARSGSQGGGWRSRLSQVQVLARTPRL